MTTSISKQALSDETGHTWEEWLMILQKTVDQAWSYEDIVNYLRDEHDVEPRWGETIAAAFEQKRGRKPAGLTAASGFQIGVRRTLPVSPERAWELLTAPEGLRLWLGGLPSLPQQGEAYLTEDGTSGQLRVLKPLSQLRMTWQPQDWEHASTVQIRLLPASSGKTTISFHQEKLEDAFRREEMKHRWEQVIAKLEERI